MAFAHCCFCAQAAAAPQQLSALLPAAAAQLSGAQTGHSPPYPGDHSPGGPAAPCGVGSRLGYHTARAGGPRGITLPKLVLWTKGPARWYCKPNHNFLLGVKNYLIVLKILLLSSKVDKVDMSGKTFPFSQWRCYLYLLNTKAINNKQFNANRRYL